MREYIVKFETDTPLSEITAGTTVRAMMKTTGDCDEVIRCKDCLHWEQFREFLSPYCSLHDRRAQKRDFCSWAERKE